jgi:hypothetical protein
MDVDFIETFFRYFRISFSSNKYAENVMNVYLNMYFIINFLETEV